jgi:hypothetical protein
MSQKSRGAREVVRGGARRVTAKASDHSGSARPRKKVARSVPSSAAPSDARAAAAYAALGRRFADQPRITIPAEKRGKFGNNALKVDGKIFAMLVRGALAVKLPPAEVESATIAGHGEPLAMGPGRVMKGWLVVNEPSPRWYTFAERARAFVAGERLERGARPATNRATAPAGQRPRTSRSRP